MTASLGSLQQWGSTLIAITIGVEPTRLAVALVDIGVLQLIRNPKHLIAVHRVASIAILYIDLY